jgi:hypothetical protein
MDLAASWMVGGCAAAEDEATDGTNLSFPDVLSSILGRGNNASLTAIGDGEAAKCRH